MATPKPDPAARPYGTQPEDVFAHALVLLGNGIRPDDATIALALRIVSDYRGEVDGGSYNWWALSLGVVAGVGKLTAEHLRPLEVAAAGGEMFGRRLGCLGDHELLSTEYSGRSLAGLWFAWLWTIGEDDVDRNVILRELLRWVAIAELTRVPSPSCKSGNGRETLRAESWYIPAGARSPASRILQNDTEPVLSALLGHPEPPKPAKGTDPTWRGEKWCRDVAPIIRRLGGLKGVLGVRDTQRAAEIVAATYTVTPVTIRLYEDGSRALWIEEGVNSNTTPTLGVIAQVRPGERTIVEVLHPGPKAKRRGTGHNSGSRLFLDDNTLVAADGAHIAGVRQGWMRRDFPREPFQGTQSVPLPTGPFREIKTRKAGT